VKQLALGADFGCGLAATGSVLCWGGQVNGELGDGKIDRWRVDPEPVHGVTNAVEIAAAYDHACARTSDGVVYCWGANDRGQLGDGTLVNRSEAVRVVF
jgi:alpha-tubulin suppressor-like RCC1 family protein